MDSLGPGTNRVSKRVQYVDLVTSRCGPKVPCEVLRELYGDTSVDSLIAAEFADALYRLVRRQRPDVVVEVGLANGASALAILTALEQNDGGHLISIDPHQSRAEGWGSRGVNAIAEAGLANRHQLIEEPDYIALPRLLEQNTSVDVAYIDGWHTFDYTLLDFFYLDKMLRVGGVVGFNDCHYPAVNRVLRFATRHRRYAPEDVGLTERRVVSPRGRLPMARWTGHRLNAADQYLRKLEAWEPGFRFWSEF